MKHVQSLLSLSLIGAFLFSFAPLVSAQDVESTLTDATIDEVLRDATDEANALHADHPCERHEDLRRVLCVARQTFRQLVQEHCTDADDSRACAQRIRRHIGQRIRHWVQNHCSDDDSSRICQGNGRLGKHKRPEISEEVREDLQECRDAFESHEERKACAMEVLEEHGIEMSHGRRGRHSRMGHNRRERRAQIRALPEDVRSELRACRNEDTREDMRACIANILEANE